MSRLQSQVAIVTGSSMGVGRAIANELLQRGATVVLNGRNPERLERTRADFSSQGYSVSAFAGDVSDPSVCRELVEHAVRNHGRLDILVNNAGISMEGEIADLAPSVVEKVTQANLFSAIYMTQSALPHLKRTRGSVLFISSAAGIHGLPRHSIYSATKMALTAVVDSLRIEVSASGVHVGIAYLGFTRNDPNKTILNAHGQIVPQPSRDFVKPAPPEEVARQVVGMIESRRNQRVFSRLGFAVHWMNRFAPGWVEWFLRRHYSRRYPQHGMLVADRSRRTGGAAA